MWADASQDFFECSLQAYPRWFFNCYQVSYAIEIPIPFLEGIDAVQYRSSSVNSIARCHTKVSRIFYCPMSNSLIDIYFS